MKLTVQATLPKGNRQTLNAFIDLGPELGFFQKKSLTSQPAFADLKRFQSQGPENPLSTPYLAAGAPALYYLPGGAAKYWDDSEKVRILAAKAWDAANERRVKQLFIVLDGPGGAAVAPLAAEGIALRAYKFTKYKADKSGPEPEVVLVVPKADLEAARAAVTKQLAVAASVNHARDLINEPGSVATPAMVEEAARAVAKAHGMKITVLQADQLKKEGYEGLITVGKGGNVPPRMIVMHYEPKGGAKKGAPRSPHLGLLGKGITFDTGGVSIKTAGGMWEMKGDMSGASAVLYAMEVIAQAAPPIKVTMVICTAQNYVDANAVVPGDIMRGRNGKTIMIDNTDAEGRLVLTDGLWRMGEEKVTHLVDVATLTGACVRALGSAMSGAMGNDQPFIEQVMSVAKTQGEPCWQLPMVEEYIEWLKCDSADLNNIANKPLAGATIAALFLREFVPEKTAWVHLDIAGTFLFEADTRYIKPGAAGVMVRTLSALAEAMGK